MRMDVMKVHWSCCTICIGGKLRSLFYDICRRRITVLTLAYFLFFFCTSASANPHIVNAWKAAYPESLSYDNFGCSLCHDNSGTQPWNPYGRAIRKGKSVYQPKDDDLPSSQKWENTIEFAESKNEFGSPNTNVDGSKDNWGQECSTLDEIKLGYNPGVRMNHPANCGSPPKLVLDENKVAIKLKTDYKTPLEIDLLQYVDDPDPVPNASLECEYDPDSKLGRRLLVEINDGPNRGKLKLNGDGRFTYEYTQTSEEEFEGDTDVFNYKVKDCTGLVSNPVTVSISVGKPQCSLSLTGNSNEIVFETPVGSLEPDTQSISLENRGIGTCNVSADFQPPISEAFSVEIDSPFTISSGEKIEVALRYSASSTETDTAQILFSTDEEFNNQEILISLSGSGFNGPVIDAEYRRVESNGYVTKVMLEALATDIEDGTLPIKTSSSPSVKGNVYRPGRYTITYSTEDSNKHVTTVEQFLDVLPLVSLGGAQMVAPGKLVDIPIKLNGFAPTYPVSIQYQIKGTDSTRYDSELTLTLSEGDSGVITLDMQGQPPLSIDEHITVSLLAVPTDNAVLSDQTTHAVTVTNNNIAPQINSIEVSQGSIVSQMVYRNMGAITVTANAIDNNGDSLTFDWSTSDITLNAEVTGSSFMFDPSGLDAGVYTVGVAVSDGTEVVNGSISLVLKDNAPVLNPASDSDLDSDGIADWAEGRGDSDRDGIPDYLDPINDEQLLNTFVSENTKYTQLLTAADGLSLALGSLALQAQDAGSGYVGAKIRPMDVRDNDGASVLDSEYDQLSGIYDFEIRGLSDAQRIAKVVIPLSSAIPAGVIVRKYAQGTWYEFVENSTNQFHTALSVNGECPAPGADDYQEGLTAFHDCLQLTLSDGGPNDADGEVNGVISDPVTLALPVQNDSVAAAPTSPPKSVSGGAVDFWWILLAAALWSRRQGKN